MKINEDSLKYISGAIIVYVFVFLLLFVGCFIFLLNSGFSNHLEIPSFFATETDTSITISADKNMSGLIATLTRAEEQMQRPTVIENLPLSTETTLTFSTYTFHDWMKFLGYTKLYYLVPQEKNNSLTLKFKNFLLNRVNFWTLFAERSEEKITLKFEKNTTKYGIILSESLRAEELKE